MTPDKTQTADELRERIAELEARLQLYEAVVVKTREVVRELDIIRASPGYYVRVHIDTHKDLTEALANLDSKKKT